jgi:transcriptional regulator with XRE-family HTH domain
MAGIESAFYVQLGERIATARKTQGIIQVQLAELLGVAQQTVAHYEGRSVRIPVETMAQLALHLSASVEALISTQRAKTRGKRGPASKLEQQLEQVGRLLKARQKFVSQMLDTVLQQAHRRTKRNASPTSTRLKQHRPAIAGRWAGFSSR